MTDLKQELMQTFPEHPIYKEYLDDLFRGFPAGAVVFELGVNEAQDTFRLLDRLKSPNYYGFEPDIDHFSKIQNIVDEYDLEISIINAAISDSSGPKTLYQSKLADGSNPGASSIKKPKNVLTEFIHVLFPCEKTVNCWSLDEFAKDNNISHINFIWADIQGAEIDMIRGGQNILLHTDYLLTEYSNNELYDGQTGLEQLLKELPGRWEIVKDYLSDVFLKRVSSS